MYKPFKFYSVNRWLKKPGAKILDIGCGNHSPSKARKYYPGCEYHGLDKTTEYNNDPHDFECIDHFYQIDLENKDELDAIPDAYFDCIMMAHIIEHLHHGEDVLLKLMKKLTLGGVIYLEFPSPHSAKLPSMPGTLNFYDDKSHVRIYDYKALNDLLSKNGFKVLRSGTRRYWIGILLTPVFIIHSLIKYKEIQGSVFWDILGFANYIIAVKTS